jgi:hypothetical protein
MRRNHINIGIPSLNRSPYLRANASNFRKAQSHRYSHVPTLVHTRRATTPLSRTGRCVKVRPCILAVWRPFSTGEIVCRLYKEVLHHIIRASLRFPSLAVVIKTLFSGPIALPRFGGRLKSGSRWFDGRFTMYRRVADRHFYIQQCVPMF